MIEFLGTGCVKHCCITSTGIGIITAPWMIFFEIERSEAEQRLCALRRLPNKTVQDFLLQAWQKDHTNIGRYRHAVAFPEVMTLARFFPPIAPVPVDRRFLAL
jgi:hypothetical protein